MGCVTLQEFIDPNALFPFPFILSSFLSHSLPSIYPALYYFNLSDIYSTFILRYFDYLIYFCDPLFRYLYATFLGLFLSCFCQTWKKGNSITNRESPIYKTIKNSKINESNRYFSGDIYAAVVFLPYFCI